MKINIANFLVALIAALTCCSTLRSQDFPEGAWSGSWKGYDSGTSSSDFCEITLTRMGEEYKVDYNKRNAISDSDSSQRGTISNLDGYLVIFSSENYNNTTTGNVTTSDVKIGGQRANVLRFTITISGCTDPKFNRTWKCYYFMDGDKNLWSISQEDANLDYDSTVAAIKKNPKRYALKYKGDF